MPETDAFLHATDFHFWSLNFNPFRLANKRIIGMANVAFRRRHEFAQHRALKLADAMAATNITPALLTGDFTSTALPEEFQHAADFVRAMEQRGMKPWVYPGNHDVYTFESQRRDRFREYLSQWMPSPRLPTTAQLPNGTPVVFVPTVCPNFLSSKGVITQSEADAVRALIDQAQEPLVVTGHYPVLKSTPQYEINPNRQLRNAELLRRVVGESGKRILYVAGHVHRFSLTRDDRFPSVTHLTTGTFFGTDHLPGKEGEFSEVRIDGGEFRVTRHLKQNGAWKTEPASRE